MQLLSDPKLLGHLAIASAAVFTGAGTYIALAMVPAMHTLDNQGLLRMWKGIAPRSYIMPLSIAMASVCGSLTTYKHYSLGGPGTYLWLTGSLMIFSILPFTFFTMLSTYTRLNATKDGEADSSTRASFLRWDNLHKIRVLLGAGAVISFIMASLK